MNYPTRPNTPNGYQILGNLLAQGGQIVDQFEEAKQAEEDKKNRLAILMQDMADKKAAAEMLKIKAEREAAAEKRKTDLETADRALKEAARVKSEQVRNEIAAGKTVPGKSVGGVVGPDETVPYSPEEANRMLFKSGDLSGKEFAATIDPTKTLEGQKEIFGVKTEAQAKASQERMKYAQAMEEYRQGRIDARTVMILKAAMDRAELSDKSKPKTESGMPLKALGDTELKTIKDIQNTAYSIGKIRALANNISTLKKGPIAGRILGKNPYDTELQSLERLVNQTVPGMARGVFGEVGVLTDQDVERYRKMLAGVKDDPKLAKQIMDDLEAKIASAYNNTIDTYDQGGRDVSGFSKGLDFGALVKGTRTAGRDPALSAAIDRSVDGIKPQEWIRDPVTGKLRPK